MWLATAPAFGQTPPPAYPVPRATGAPRALPGSGAAAQTGEPLQRPEGAGSRARRGAASTGITVSTLGDTEGPPTGTLDSTNGGLGPALWSGTSRASAEVLMARLPLATPVAPIRALARRIILTRAAPPVGAADRAFMTVRLTKLLDAGLLSDAGTLASIAKLKHDPGFARVQAEALLYAGVREHLCDGTTSRRLESSKPFWIELRAYCYAESGNDAALALTQSVMDAQDVQDDAFSTLLEDIQQNVSEDPGDVEAPTALHAFLLRRAGLAVGFDVGVQLGTPGLLLAFRSPDNSPEDRLKAAERLLPSGALSPQELIAVADAQSFTPDQFATEHAQVVSLPFLAGQALLRQAVARALPDARAALINEALTTADAHNMLGVAAVLQQHALGALVPAPAMHDMADRMARALLLTGNADGAARWAALFDSANPADARLLARLQVLLNLVAPNPMRRAQAQRGFAEMAGEAAAQGPDSAYPALALGLCEALGDVMPNPARDAARVAMQKRWPGRRPAGSQVARLHQALQGHGRKGEALMLVLNGIGARGPGDLAPDVTVGFVRALIAEGQADAARNIAIAALLRYRAPPPPAPSSPQASTPP